MTSVACAWTASINPMLEGTDPKDSKASQSGRSEKKTTMTSGFGKNMDKGTNTHFTLTKNTN